MEGRKIIKRVAIGLACLLIAGLIGYVIFQDQQLKKLSQGDGSDLHEQDESAGKDITGKSEVPLNNPALTGVPASEDTGDTKELEYQLEAAEEELDAAHKQLSEEAAKKADNAKNIIDMQKKMLQDPSYKKLLRNTYKGQLDTTYGPLFMQFNLSSEKLDQLKELLIDQMMSSMEIGLDIFGEAATEEKKNEIKQRLDNLKKENDAKISALIGSQNFSQYETYRETLSERQIASGYTDSLREGDNLTDAQLETLINAMYRERKDVYSQQGWAEDSGTSYSEINEEDISKIMDINDRVFEGYIKSAESTLSASQMEQFKSFLKNRREMTESALKVSAQLLGGRTTQTDNDKKQE